MKALRYFILLTLLSLSWYSCETDVDIFAEPKETAVVFALLNQSDSVQYFRINPTFLGQGDANDLAADPDVTNYREGEIEVALIDMTTDQIYKAKETDKKKLQEEGIFDPYIRMYALSTPVDTNEIFHTIENEVLKGDHSYQLLVKHVESGKQFTSTVTIGDINGLEMTNPSDRQTSSTSFISFYTNNDYYEYQFRFAGVPGALKYLVEMKYYYVEGDEDSTLKERYVTIKLGEINAVANQESFILKFDGERFYNILEKQLAENGIEVDRRGQSIDIEFTVFGKEISTYIDVQNASQTGISQERPSYSNITNGLGVFSWAHTFVYQNYKMTEASLQHLLDGPYTQTRFRCGVHAYAANANGIFICR